EGGECLGGRVQREAPVLQGARELLPSPRLDRQKAQGPLPRGRRAPGCKVRICGRRSALRLGAPWRLIGEVEGRLLLKRIEAVRALESRVHLLASHVRRGLDALDLELELVGIGRALQGFLERDQARLVKAVERLVESLHAVLRSSLL